MSKIRPLRAALVLLAACGGAETAAAPEMPAMSSPALDLSRVEARLLAAQTDPMRFANVLRELAPFYDPQGSECGAMHDATFRMVDVQIDDDDAPEHVLSAQQSTALGEPSPCHSHLLAFFDGPARRASLVDVRFGVDDPCSEEYVEPQLEGAVLHTRRAEACGSARAAVVETRTLRVHEGRLMLGDPTIEEHAAERSPETPGRPGEPCSWPSNSCEGDGLCSEGVCVAKSCTATSECSYGWGCDGQRCVQAECFANASDAWAPRRDCEGGRTCSYEDALAESNGFGRCR